eukprot:143885-Rhodomonas_salina.3
MEPLPQYRAQRSRDRHVSTGHGVAYTGMLVPDMAPGTDWGGVSTGHRSTERAWEVAGHTWERLVPMPVQVETSERLGQKNSSNKKDSSNNNIDEGATGKMKEEGPG